LHSSAIAFWLLVSNRVPLPVEISGGPIDDAEQAATKVRLAHSANKNRTRAP